jgi:hypothetical protein
VSSKIRIKIGDVEVEYEGTEQFLRDELPKLLTGVLELHRAEQQSNGKPSATTNPSHKDKSPPVGSSIGTTKTVSAKLGVTSGSDLVLAAAARLSIGDDKETFTRSELLTEMKTASGYYKASYSNNLSKSLQALVSSGRLRETAKETYTLSADELGQLETKLAS